MISVEELNKEEKLRKERKKKCYYKILELINNKIILISKNNKKNTFFEIPFFLLGYPIYEINECYNFLKKKLEKNKFNVYFLNPNIILIYWN